VSTSSTIPAQYALCLLCIMPSLADRASCVHAYSGERRPCIEILNRYANMSNMVDSPAEKRICTRYLADYEIEVRSTGADEQAQYEKTVMTDFSDEGLNFITHYPERYSEGQKLSVRILLPKKSSERDSEFSGTVAWASDPDISTCGELVQPRVGVMIDDGNISWLLESDREDMY